MSPPRRTSAQDSDTRTALLDAAGQLMVDEGYAGVSSRRVATTADVDASLVYYYFGTMDDLFIALFRRSAERSLERQAQMLSSPKPLWGLWDSTRDQFDTRLLMEFNALANHRKAVRAEIGAFSEKFRRMQIDTLTPALERYGIDLEAWPPASITLMITGISQFMLLQDAFGVHIGHDETTELIERFICKLEGARRSTGEGA